MPSEIIYSVFVSSTYEDLREERAAVQKALLQLKCMPIGMEFFGSADEGTWEFIKRQIEDCDYYVVIVAGKYGSTAEDGLSYTEKEYDYAREIKKPVLGFVHGNRGGITRDKTEDDPQKRAKLETFIEKVGKSPVSFFTATDDLATKVTVSFVNLRDERPAVGFIRTDRVPEDRLSAFMENTPHPAYIFKKVETESPVEFKVVECNPRINDLLNRNVKNASEPEMQKQFLELVHPVYREHWRFMQSFYRWELTNRDRPILHHPTFLVIPRRSGQPVTHPYAGRLWSADIYSARLGPSEFLCLVHLEEATPAEEDRLKQEELMPNHEKPWISDLSEYYRSKDYEAYKKTERRRRAKSTSLPGLAGVG